MQKANFNLGSFPRRRLRFQTREKFAENCFLFIAFCPFIPKTSRRFALISSHLYLFRAYSCLPLGWRYRWQHHVYKFTISPLKRKVGGRTSLCVLRSEALSWPRPLTLGCQTVMPRCNLNLQRSLRWHNRLSQRVCFLCFTQ